MEQCYEVVMAYVFNKPTLWNFDFSMQMYGAILMMSGAYCLATESHVRGDVIYRLFKPRTQAWIRFSTLFYFLFPWCNCFSILWSMSTLHLLGK